MVVTDLDGTLLNDRHQLSVGNREALVRLAHLGVVRVVATGRSLYSACHVMDRDFPVDYLVFSSGAGVVSWPARELLRARDMEHGAALDAAEVLREAGLDFMLHDATPANHRFFYYQSDGRGAGTNPDFHRRIGRYTDHCQAWPEAGPGNGPFSQLLAIEGSRARVRLEELRATLSPLHVVRTTSPLDHASYWYEIFAPGVNKADGARWVLERYHLDHRHVLALGNDFNDEDLLDWAHQARVVANAPAELRQRFDTAPANVEDGFSVAVGQWWSERQP